MINLTKQGSSLVVKSDDTNVFPFKNGTISLPMNSLYIVIDGSDYVSFKQAQDNNQIFGTEISKIRINGTQATKENIITLFDSVANAIAQGGGGGGGAVDSVNGQTGTVIITPQNIGTYTSSEIDTKLGAKQDTLVSGTNIKTINGETILGEGDITITSAPTSVEWDDIENKPTFATVATSGDYNDLTNKPEIPSLEGYATESFVTDAVSGESTERQKQDTALGGMIAAETEAREAADSAINETLETKQDTLISGTNIKTINSQSLLGEGNIEIQVEGGGITDAPNDGKLYGRKSEQWSEVIIPDTSNLATKDEIPTNVSQLTNDSNYITEEEATSQFAASADLEEKQDVLVSGVNIKTINGATILGEGNISIETPEGGISDAPKDGNTYARRDGAWTSITIPSLEGYITETAADAKYQPKGDYLTEVPSEYVTDSELNGKGYLTTAQASETYQPKGDYALKSEIPSTANLVTTEELNEAVSGKANTSDLSNYLLKSEASDSYADKSSLEELKTSKLDVSVYNQDKATFALKTELPDTSDMLTRTEASSTYQVKGDYITTTVADGKYQPKGEYATDEELNGKQDALVSGTNIKTINSQSILGSGNITIEGGGSDITAQYYSATNGVQLSKDSINLLSFAPGANITFSNSGSEKQPIVTISSTGGGISDAPNDDKTYGRKNGAWSEITEQDLSNYALKSEVPKQYVQEIAFIAPTSINIFDQENNLKMISFADGITLGENGGNVEVKLSDSFVNKVDAKQDALTAGEGISIQGNTISTTLSKEWFGTSASYAEIVEKDANTLYYITDDTTE